MLEIMFIVAGLWAVLMLGALGLARGIVLAASAADRNTRRQLLVRRGARARMSSHGRPTR